MLKTISEGNARIETEVVKNLDEWSLKNSYNSPQSFFKTTKNFNNYTRSIKSCSTENSIHFSPAAQANIAEMMNRNEKMETKLNENQLLATYNELNESLEKMSNTKDTITVEKTTYLTQINQLKMKNSAYHEDIKKIKNEQSVNSPLTMKKNCISTVNQISKYTKCEKIRELMKENDIEISRIKTKLDQVEFNIKEVEHKITQIKTEILKSRHQLNELYLDLLEKAEDIRAEGIGWIIKAILNIKGAIKTIKFPYFLDQNSIEYLITVSKKEYQISQYRLEAGKLQNNGSLFYVQKLTEIHEKVQKLRSEIYSAKELEIQRLNRELAKNSQKYNVSKEKLFVTLFGTFYYRSANIKIDVFLYQKWFFIHE